MRPCRLVNEQARSFQLRGHLSELEFDALKFGDRPAELPARLAVTNRFIQRPLRKADGGRADAAS